MSSIGKIVKKVGSRFLSYYELEAVHRDGSVSPYYMVSRNPDLDTLKAVTHSNPPDGVIVYGVHQDKVVLIRQYRYPIGGFIYEFPAGLVEPGEEMEHPGNVRGNRTDPAPHSLRKLWTPLFHHRGHD